jgi:putative DNA primase/helicase
LGRGTWIEDRCECKANVWTKTTVLFSSWKDWAEKAGVRFGNIKTFGETMTEKGFTWKHTANGNGYLGLRIRQDEPPPTPWREG